MKHSKDSHGQTPWDFPTITKSFKGFEMVKAGKYSTGEIDSQWTDVIKSDFLKWLEKHPELGKMTRAELDKMMSKRTW